MNEITARRAVRQFTENHPDGRVLAGKVQTAVKGDLIATAGILAAVETLLANNESGQPWQRNERIPASWQPLVTHTSRPAAGVKSAVIQGLTGVVKRLARVKL